MSTMTMMRPRVIPFRWDGHGLDIRAHITQDGVVFFFTTDVCTALEVQVEWERDPDTDLIVHKWPVPTSTVEGLNDGEQPAELCTVHSVRRLISNNPGYMSGEFSTWFEELLEQLDTATIEAALETHLPASEYLPVAGGVSFTVARTARILSGDPVIQIGQTALFEQLRQFGWVERVAGWWRAGQVPVRNGWCVVQPRRIPGRKDMYPQIRLTRAGVLELHRLLGGVAEVTFDAPPALTLVEL